MLQVNRYFESESERKIIHLHREEGESLKFANKYVISHANISYWMNCFIRYYKLRFAKGKNYETS